MDYVSDTSQELREQKRCKIKGCTKNKYAARGYCGSHYSKYCIDPVYRTWLRIKARCYNPKSNVYSHYGGRGIKLCDEWLNDYSAFAAYMGKKPTSKHSIDRIDVDGDYEPGNVRWVSIHEQVVNVRKKNATRGVYYNASTNRYHAQMIVNGQPVLRKTYIKLEDALAARRAAEIKYGITYQFDLEASVIDGEKKNG